MNAFRSLDGGEDIDFTRMPYTDTAGGTDTCSMWRAEFAGDGQVVGYGASLPQAAADLYQQQRERRATRLTAGGARALAGAM